MLQIFAYFSPDSNLPILEYEYTEKFRSFLGGIFVKRIALIPAYKPDTIMIDVITELKNNSFHIVVVDDGSGEDFTQLFQEAEIQATILKHTENKGKGASLKTGIKYINEHFKPPYVIVTADADGQHKTEDINRICAEAIKRTNSLIIGSRKLNSSVPFRSKFGNTITRFVFSLSTGRKIYDTQTGLRAFSDKLIPDLLKIKGNRYEYEINVLMELTKKNTEILELPIETVYLDKNNSSSHFNSIKDSYRIYKEILKFSASSLICFCVDYILFCIIVNLTGVLILSNIVSRIFSSILNYSLNRKIVFKSNRTLFKSTVGYFSLAVCILFFNTLLVKMLCTFGLSAYISKIITEIVLFSFSWFIQHTVIFKRSDK